MDKLTGIARNLVICAALLLFMYCDATFWHVLPFSDDKSPTLDDAAFRFGIMFAVGALALASVALRTYGRSRARIVVCTSAMVMLIGYAAAYGVKARFVVAASTISRPSNQAMQLTAPRSVSPLSVATTFSLQPRALSGAVADLVSR
jgi:hypothetical protein